jgi:hypothetical protein
MRNKPILSYTITPTSSPHSPSDWLKSSLGVTDSSASSFDIASMDDNVSVAENPLEEEVDTNTSVLVTL